MGKASQEVSAIWDLNLFDAWCVVGRQFSRAFRRGYEASELIDLMDQYDIKEALVSHAAGRHNYVSCRIASRILMDEIAAHPRLHPCWTLFPEMDWHADTPERLVEDMLDSGARAAHLPAVKLPFELWSWSPLLRVLEAHRVPCLVDYGSRLTLSVSMVNTLDWQKIYDIATAFPKLPLILTGFRFPRKETFLLMQHSANVHTVDFAYADPGKWPSEQTLPAERFLLGTGIPQWDPGMVVSVAQYSERLDERGKKLVSGDNLRRLLEEVR